MRKSKFSKSVDWTTEVAYNYDYATRLKNDANKYIIWLIWTLVFGIPNLVVENKLPFL